MSYPILLDLHGRRVVVVGGGNVAARKLSGLLEAGALVTVISPALHPDLAALGERIEVQQRAYAPGMLTNMTQWGIVPLLVFAATDSGEVNRQVADEARALGIRVSVADDGGAGDFATMATVRRGAITLAVASDGAGSAPAREAGGGGRRGIRDAGGLACRSTPVGARVGDFRLAARPVAGDHRLARIGSAARW